MSEHPATAETILAVDFGTANTRASLFDVVEGVYRFVAYGEAPSTIDPPYMEASEGMRHALAELQAVTGRVLLDEGSRLILPATPDSRGVDRFVATSSAGPAARAVLLGLLPDVSLESARRLAASNYVSVVDTLSLGDRRREDQQIDAVIAARPQLILIAGGTDGGATEALGKLVETVGLACHLLPPDTKVKVLYVGNAAFRDRVADMLNGVAVVHSAPNVTPQLGIENYGPARSALSRVIEELRVETLGGFQTLSEWAGGSVYPTASAAGQVIRYFSKALGPTKGVLGVDVGSASTSIAAAFGGDLHLTVRSDLGVGVNAAQVLREWPVDQFTRWLPEEVDGDLVRDFILNKSLFPATVPASLAEAHLEYALARQVIRAALRRARRDWPLSVRGPRPDLLPRFELIIGGGSVLAHAPNPGLAALLLIDSLQPTGLTDLFLDAHHLTAALGALAYVNPTAAVQLLDGFLSLGPVVSVVGAARPDEVVCQARLVTEGGAETEVDVKYGTLEVLPLPLSQTGTLSLKPRLGIDVGFGPGRGRTIKGVTGGVVGVIVDARGRPIVPPKDPVQRRETVQEWMLKAGGA